MKLLATVGKIVLGGAALYAVIYCIIAAAIVFAPQP